MLRAITNLLYRGKDPTRNWFPNSALVRADLHHCSLCGTRVGGLLQPGGALEAIGPSEDAKRAARGFLEWPSQGINCLIDEQRLSDFTIAVKRWTAGPYHAFAGKLEFGGQALDLRGATAEDVIKRLGEPFARSTADGTVLFYEFDAGEVQFAFDDDDNTLVTIECAYEAELADDRSRKFYGIERELPAAMAQRRLD